MKNNIRISVLGSQNTGSEPEAILTKTIGMYCFEDGFHKINYCELDENGTATDNLLSLSETESYHLDIKGCNLDAQLKYRLYTGGRLLCENSLTVQTCEYIERRNDLCIIQEQFGDLLMKLTVR